MQIFYFYAPYCFLFVIRTQAEMGHTCRGTINLATANISVEDSCNFVISNGGAQTYHLKANSEVERQRWITALELAKAKAIHMQAESGEKKFDYRRLVYECMKFLRSFPQMILVTIVHQYFQPLDKVEVPVSQKSSLHCAL